MQLPRKTLVDMKILRVRFRNLSILCVLCTVTLVLVYLPPSYRPSQLLLSNPETLEEKALQVQELEEEISGSGDGVQNKEQDPSSDIKSEVESEDGGQHEPAPAQGAERLANKTVQADATKPEVDHPLSDANEHDSYVQDYPDYTPQDFVEVMKDKPSKSVPPNENGKRDKFKKKLAKLKSSLLQGDKRSSRYTPGALMQRALTFPENSTLRAFLTEQDQRAQHLKTKCEGFEVPINVVQSRGMIPPPGLAGAHNLLIDRTNFIAYCPIYKAASTSWTKMLLEIGGFWDKTKHNLKKNQKLQAIVQQVFPKISNFAGPAFTQGMTRFVIVRHPFERLLSCYRDKFQLASKGFYYERYGRKMVRTYRHFDGNLTSSQIGMLDEQVRAKVHAGLPVNLPGNPFTEPLGPTFSEFVQYVLKAKHDDEHWRTYYDHCSPCHMSYQFILRFEHVNTEGRELIEYLNRSSQVEMRWENPTHGGSTNDVICSYYSQLTREMILGLIKKYEKDFILFQYSPDGYLECVDDGVETESEKELDHNGTVTSPDVEVPNPS